MSAVSLPQPTPSERAILTSALLRAASSLDVSGTVLAKVIGLSEATLSRMKRGEYLLEQGSKSFELAVLFVRLFRSLDAIVGGDDAVARSWLRNANAAMAGRPIDQIKTVAGLTDAIAYLDADALASEARALQGRVWRLVEAQHQVSTLKLTDTLAEQAVLERLIETTKPLVPAPCAGLHYLLATPFRYGAVYPHGSRFRRAGRTPGVFYAAEAVETAVAEMAFYRLLFFAESPDTPWPKDAKEFTAFAADIVAEKTIDLTRPPLSADHHAWTHPTDYTACQALAEAARAAGVAVIRYASVRDPAHGGNIAVLACEAFASPNPTDRQTWRLRLSPSGAQAIRAFPVARIEFDREAFAADPRMSGVRWQR